jgi:membrane protein
VSIDGFRHARGIVGTLVSREIMVLTNAIAFNFLLCLFPLIVVVASLARQLPGGAQRAASALLLVLQELIPFGQEAMSRAMREMTRTAASLQVAALLVILWGSSGIFMPVEMAMNRAWGARPNRHFIRSKVLAFLMTLLGGLLVLASVGLTVAARNYGHQWPAVARYGGKLSALVLSYVLFFVIYRVIPEAPVRTSTAARAALITGTVWEIVKYVFVVRLPGMQLQAYYGPLAFSVSLILWAYVSSLVLVFGALVVGASPPQARPGPAQVGRRDKRSRA